MLCAHHCFHFGLVYDTLCQALLNQLTLIFYSAIVWAMIASVAGLAAAVLPTDNGMHIGRARIIHYDGIFRKDIC